MEKQICCSHILKKERDVLLVIRTERCFQFLCGDSHDDEPELIDIEELINYDISIKHVIKMKKNHMAERDSKDDLWTLQYDNEGDD